jgi:hypothetical protein
LGANRQITPTLAQNDVTSLGRVLGKAGHSYCVPDTEIRKSVSMCERLHRVPPKALVVRRPRLLVEILAGNPNCRSRRLNDLRG